MTPDEQIRIEANLFPASQTAIGSWDLFRWHHDRQKKVDTWKPHSSQALAIDVFGLLQVVDCSERDLILNDLADRIGVASGGPWTVELEWEDADNRLHEKAKTQVDAVARSPRSLIFFECKFTESDGGTCSQPAALTSGANKGTRQCNGSYEPQLNPVNGIESKCALSGKGIRYWDVIPSVFDFSSSSDQSPCPFAGSWYQWMRNLTLAHEVAHDSDRDAAFVVIYADASELPMAQLVASREWQDFVGHVRRDAIAFDCISYQQLLEGAVQTLLTGGQDVAMWHDLGSWVERKIVQAVSGVDD